MRSADNANDFATTKDVVREVIEAYQKNGQEFDQLCCIYPTAPFVTPKGLKEAMELLNTPGTQGAMPVVRFSFPPQRSLIIEEGSLRPKWPENTLKRSQDLEPMYHDAGQFYCLDVKSFLEQDTMVPAVTAPIVLSDLEVQDIDNEEDWKLAELKYSILNRKNV
jgi:N-acylneuraminate cytidylyltransferase